MCRPEIWKFVNDSGGWAHPIHVHMEQFKILSKQDSDTGRLKPIEPHEAGLIDVAVLHENETIRVIATFKDPNNHFDNTPGVLQDYAFHCHNIDHEDMDMMATQRLFTGDAPPKDPASCEPEEN
jgi:FtsP/CotA-like multicopper oxidase with cupredoxin domain